MLAIAERAAEEIRGEVRSRGGAVTVRGEFGQVDGDEVLLRQAFSNLCRNALEACTRRRRSAADRARGHRRSVAATSCAIDRHRQRPRHRRRRRAIACSARSSPRKAQGTGLGLALVQKIVVTHNGRVAAMSAERGGARLSVTLPLRALS